MAKQAFHLVMTSLYTFYIYLCVLLPDDALKNNCHCATILETIKKKKDLRCNIY